MKINEIAFTGYPVTDLKRARHFYEDVLGLKPTQIFGDDTAAWIEYDIGPGTLAICNGQPDWKASPGGGCIAFEVDDFAAALKTIEENKVQHIPPMESPACRMLIISDPDGNSIALHKRKSS